MFVMMVMVMVDGCGDGDGCGDQNITIACEVNVQCLPPSQAHPPPPGCTNEARVVAPESHVLGCSGDLFCKGASGLLSFWRVLLLFSFYRH